MLERFSEIQGVGLLHDANGKPYGCRKATLIYADNGRGKSTLTAVLRSVATGDVSSVIARKTLDGRLPPKVVLQFGSGHKVTYEHGVWAEQRPEFHVFDADFVERNVHSGGSVTTGHRKNLLEFALGEAAVEARAAVEKATGEAKAASENVQNYTGQLSGYHPGMPLASFEKLPPVPNIDAKIGEQQKRLNAASNLAAILGKPVPVAVSEPSFNIDSLFVVLRHSLEDVHDDSERIVKQHIAKLGMREAEPWVSQGGQFTDGTVCPYCGQETAGVDLVRAYRTYFNTSYKQFKETVAKTADYVFSETSPRIIEQIAQSVSTASALAAAWEDHVKTELIPFDVAASKAALELFKSLVTSLILQKQASPGESIGTTKEEEAAKQFWQKVIEPISAVNYVISKAVEQINAYKNSLGSVDLAQLREEERVLMAIKARHDSKVVEILTKLDAARVAQKTAAGEKEAARAKLDSRMTETLKHYEATINQLLANFGASFSIKGMSANFRGAGPRSDYGLLLRGKDVPLEGGPPSFTTALSEGDKRTLAFAFFIASTLEDDKLATRIVVIDDPMCSLDLNRKHQTRTALKKIHSKSAQLIVLAHDAYFIRDLRDALLKEDKSAQIALFQLKAAPDDYTDFGQLDIDKVCESAYFQHHRLLSDFADGKDGDPRTVAKAIRPLLEGYLHRRFPGKILKDMLFGQVVDEIRKAVPPSPLRHAASLVDELNEINDFAGQFHHGTNPDGADTVQVTASGLKPFVNRALAIVHGGA